MADGENDTNKDAAPATRPLAAGGPAAEPHEVGVTSTSEVGASEIGRSGSPSTIDRATDPSTIEPAVAGSTGSSATQSTPSDARGPLGAATSAPTGTHDPFEPAPAASAPPVAPRRSVAGPVFAGLVIGALVGAGSAALVYRLAPSAGHDDDPRVAALSARVDALDRRPDPQPAIADVKGSVAALDRGLAALRTNVAALGQARGTAPQGPAPQGPASQGPASQAPSPSAAGPAAPFDPAPLQQKVAALQGDVDALRKDDAAAKGDARDLQGKLASAAAALAAAQKEAADALNGVHDVQGQQQGLQSRQKALEGKLNAPALAVVADSLVQQIARGLPYATQVDALAAIGADPARVAILRQGADKGVPTAKALGDAFEPLADPVAATGRKTPPGAGFLARLQAGLFSLVSIRSADDTEGTGTASRVARIQADLTHDDVADAAATWQALPPEAKAKSQAWGALAKTQTEAMAAARALQHDAIAALGAKKS